MAGRFDGRTVECGLDVDEHTTLDQLAPDVVHRQGGEFLVRHCGHDGVGPRQGVPGQQRHAVLVDRLIGLGLGVGHEDLDAVGPQLMDDVDDLGVAQVAAILLECQTQHVDLGALDVAARCDHQLDGLFGDELAHAIVDAPAGQDDLRVVAQHFGLVRQVVGVHADAVPADQAGLEAQEVPLGSCSFQHFGGVDAQLVENDRQLVHQGDVEVALGVLDHLGRLRGLDGRGPVHAGHDDLLVEPGHSLQGCRRVARDDFQDLGKGVFLVAGVDPFRRVADEEVLFPLHAGLAFQHRYAHVLRRAGVDRGLIDHDGTLLHVPAHAGARTDQRTKIRDVGAVDRRGNGHHDDVCLAQEAGVGGVDRVGGKAHVCVRQFARRIDTTLAGFDL